MTTSIVIDGYWFINNFDPINLKNIVQNVNLIEEFIEYKIAGVEISKEDRYFFHPDHDEALALGLTKKQFRDNRERALKALEDIGWKVILTGFVKVNGVYKCQREDSRLQSRVERMERDGFKNIIIATNDRDHVPLFKNRHLSNRYWLFFEGEKNFYLDSVVKDQMKLMIPLDYTRPNGKVVDSYYDFHSRNYRLSGRVGSYLADTFGQETHHETPVPESLLKSGDRGLLEQVSYDIIFRYGLWLEYNISLNETELKEIKTERDEELTLVKRKSILNLNRALLDVSRRYNLSLKTAEQLYGEYTSSALEEYSLSASVVEEREREANRDVVYLILIYKDMNYVVVSNSVVEFITLGSHRYAMFFNERDRREFYECNAFSRGYVCHNYKMAGYLKLTGSLDKRAVMKKTESGWKFEEVKKSSEVVGVKYQPVEYTYGRDGYLYSVKGFNSIIQRVQGFSILDLGTVEFKTYELV
jgi:hypothetical protein